MDALTTILIAVLGTGVVISGIIAYTLSHYSELKLFFSDLLRLVGFLGKWFRRASVSNEIEGTLNGVIDDFNKNFSSPILPNCKIKWVTSENQSNVLKENEAIICLSFDKKDHDLNFFNATYNFIQTALIARAKPFFRKTTAKAVDLLSTKIILKQYRREVLRTFNTRFIEVEQETKYTFHRLDETDENGLFSTFLLPELHHLGELLNEKTPHQNIENEIEQFVNWFCDLATRDFDEKSILRFESPNIKVGVILVAKLSTYNQYGIEAYTKWAEKYASEHYNAVYLLSKGTHRNSITRDVARTLIETNGFEQINKNSIIKRPDKEGNPIIITCICLRPDAATIRYNAWEFVKEKFSNKKKVIGIIETITKDELIVNVAGLQCKVSNKQLSSTPIPDATKLFREEQELELVILDCNPEQEVLSLSNIGTQTDPKALIDANLQINHPIKARVTAIQRDKDNLEKGIRVRCDNPFLNVFIPRSKTTFSRFVDISKRFKVDDEVTIVLEEFSFDYGNYIGQISGLQNPWKSETFEKLENGNEIKVIVREIQERFLTCEIVEGLECKLFANEISWEQSDCSTNNFKIDREIQVKVIAIDTDHKRISVSMKQFNPSPVETHFEENKDIPVHATVTSIDDANGVFIKGEKIIGEGFVHWSELVWGNIYPISQNISVGDSILVKPTHYVLEYDSIRFSCKRALLHQFADFLLAFDDRGYVEGRVLRHYSQIATIEVHLNDLTVQAYLHKSKISNCGFINGEDIPKYLPKNEIFNFVVERIDEKHQIIELSRKIYLKEVRQVEVGGEYNVAFAKSEKDKTYFYSNDLEGFIEGQNNHFTPGQNMSVFPVSESSDEFLLG